MNGALRRRPVLAWAFYDWANSAFATTVMAGFFPVFFKQHWNVGVPVTESTFRLGMTSGIASALIALAAPVLGAIADRSGARVRLLMGFTVMGAAATAALALVAGGTVAGGGGAVSRGLARILGRHRVQRFAAAARRANRANTISSPASATRWAISAAACCSRSTSR